MEDILESLQEKLELNNIFQFRISSFKEDGTLTIVGDFDLSYCHSVEIIFKETTYISCPITFSDASFRFATESEKQALKPKLISEWNDLIVCIVLDDDLYGSAVKHFIFAEEVQYRFGTVYYYKRENLEEGEKIAEWVK